MQSLDVISINIWQILISLCNLVILFLILKRFLYKPVQRILQARQDELDARYQQADDMNAAAKENQAKWEAKMDAAKSDAAKILETANQQAGHRSDELIAEAKQKADTIVRDAKAQAALEQKKAEAGIKKEIIDVSTVLTEKLLEREITPDDHRAVIDSVLSEIGDDND
jgi:F-type H+-transporting ATPase subunit b